MMSITPVHADSPRMRRALAFLAGLFVGRIQDAPRELEHPAKPTTQPKRRKGPQELGPKQLAWLEERFKFYGIHRKQAEAPTGVAVVRPGEFEAPVRS